MSMYFNLHSQDEVILAKESARAISAFLDNGRDIQEVDIHDSKGHHHEVRLPKSALKLLVDILNEVSSGNSVAITPVNAVLTTQQAADILNVSRPYFVSLLENGFIPYEKKGTHRRVGFLDLMEYKQKVAESSKNALDEMASISEELGLYDE